MFQKKMNDGRQAVVNNRSLILIALFLVMVMLVSVGWSLNPNKASTKNLPPPTQLCPAPYVWVRDQSVEIQGTSYHIKFACMNFSNSSVPFVLGPDQ